MIATSTIKYGFAPVALNVSTIYDVNILVVNMCVTCYFIAFIVANFPAIYLLDQGKEQGQGVYRCLKIASFVQVLAAWGRYLALEMTDNFYVLLACQLVGSLCYPFF